VNLDDVQRSAVQAAGHVVFQPGLTVTGEQDVGKQRADERIQTADLLHLRVIIQALQGFAGCCTVLRSRWCQSGVKSGG
jgi:hypothetical protein